MDTIFVVPNEAKASLRGLVKLAKGSDRMRPALRLVQVVAADGWVTLSATDSYIAARVRFQVDGPWSAGTWLLDADGLGRGLTGTGSTPVPVQLLPSDVLVGSVLVELSDLSYPNFDSVWNMPPAIDDYGPHEFGFDAGRMATLLASVPKGARVGTVAHDLKPILMRASSDNVHWAGLIMPVRHAGGSHPGRVAWVGGAVGW